MGDLITNIILCFAGVIIGSVAMTKYFESKHKISYLIAECEQELPRTKKCVLVAVPEESENE